MTDHPALTEDQRDCLQELFNVAMGQAGDALARKLQRFVRLSIPRISLLAADQLQAMFVARAGAAPVSAVRHPVSGPVVGETLVVFFGTSVANLAADIATSGVVVDEDSMTLELAELLGRVCMEGFAAELELPLVLGAPTVLGQQVPASSLLGAEESSWHRALVLDINYQLESCPFECDLFFLIPDGAVSAALARVDQILLRG